MNQEFPPGSRWRHRQAFGGPGVLVYGEVAGHVSYRTAKSELPMLLAVDAFKRCYVRIEHPEAPRCSCGGGCELCSGERRP